MSLKSFHVIFIIISSLFMVYFSYWSIMNWINYSELFYMFYAVLSTIAFVFLLIYSKKFLNKYKGITS